MENHKHILMVLTLVLVSTLLVVPVLAGDATTIAINAGGTQSATAGNAVTTLPSVLVTDGTNPVSGVTVTFVVASGGGSVTGGTATTGSNGIATVGSWTLGTTPGMNTLTVTNTSLIGSPLTFTATGTAGTATQLVKYSGDSQSATVGTSVSTLPSVIVRDANNNPVSGVSVTFAVTSGGGTATGASATTGTNGIATAGGWTLGTTAGTNILTVTSGSLTPVTFIATGTTTTSAPTITAITPTYGYNTSVVSITGLTGTGFVSGATIVLVKSGQTNISTSSSSFSSATLMTCTFDITGKPAGYRDVILTNPDGQSYTLTDGFEIRYATNGTINFKSSPAGAVVYLNASKIGTTPFSLDGQLPGSYFIRMQKPDYSDYTTQVIVTPGGTSYVYAYLTTASVETTSTTALPQLTNEPATVKTTKKTPTKIPTPWPTSTPTQASPVGLLVILGAIGVGFVILRKD
ncbi:PEGA domain-containing protein [uncultured Methanoregula sp.]|uniref:PEGA domain-containing protein n=1 Tax=uncultured Methanoregula sp. TaxID=1005933 RepID=UPI002AAB91F7|nr:PEGA domain-containing protein [uncultured Methanoregula sp.]